MKLSEALKVTDTDLYRAIGMDIEFEEEHSDDFVKTIGMDNHIGYLLYKIQKSIPNPMMFIRKVLDTKFDHERVYVEFTIKQLEELNTLHDDKAVHKVTNDILRLYKTEQYKDEKKMSAAGSAAHSAAHSAAWSAAYSAANSAAWSAASSAARSVAYLRKRDWILELIEEY